MPTGTAISLVLPSPKSKMILTEAAGEYLRVVDLAQPLTPGRSVRIIFDFGDGRTKELAVPVGIPLSPAARESAEVSEEH
jgi:hypothetical protein